MNDTLPKPGLDASMSDAHDHRLSSRFKHRPLLHSLTLTLILLVAILLRFSDLNWDQGQHFHPDERHVTNVLSGVQLPSGVGQYFDSGKSPLNPYNIPQSWVYGTLPLFLDRFLAEYLDKGCVQPPVLIPGLFGQFILSVTGDPNLQTTNCTPGFFTSYDLLTIASRFVSAVADLITVVVVYLMGRRLFGWRLGLLATAFSALCVLQIQHAHFGVVESMATMCVTWCLYFCARIVTLQPSASRWHGWRGNATLWGSAALAGLFSGLAVACKITVWPTALLILVSIVIALVRGRRAPLIAIVSASVAVLVAGLFAFIGLRITQPYGFVGASETEWKYTIHSCDNIGDAKQQSICLRTLPLPVGVTNIIMKFPLFLREIIVPSARWIAELQSAAAQSSGTDDPPWGWQWANRMPIVFSLINVLFYGLGLPLGISAVIGAFYALRQWMYGRRWWIYVVPVLWTLGFFLYQSTQFVKSIRYLLPIYPVLCILAAVFLVALWQKGRQFAAQKRTGISMGRVKRVFCRVAMPVVLIGTAIWSLSFMHIYDGDMARVESSRWIYNNVPTAVTMTWRDGGRERHVQLPIRDVQLRANDTAHGGMFRLDSKIDGVVGPIRDVAIRLNGVQGSGEVEARIFEVAQGNTLQSVKRTVNKDDAAFTFDQATLRPDTDYGIEFSLVQGQVLNARTSVIANQHYDEGGPVRIDGKDGFGAYYYGLTSTSDGNMQVYNEDNPDKLDMLLRGLDEADYLVLYSNRHYGSVARLPWRFPLTNAYFTALMGGRLGFELAADFYRFPQIGTFVFNDQEMPQPLVRSPNTQGTPPGIDVPYPTAEEAFSVYDHPRVLVFHKTPQYTRVRAEQILGIYDLTHVVRQTAFEATNAPGGLLLDQKTLAAQQVGGTWSELFPRSSPLNLSQPLAVLAWVALVEVLGVAAFMLMAAAVKTTAGRASTIDSRPSTFRWMLIDGGYAFGKTLGLLLVAFAAWWLGSVRVVQFTPLAIWCIIGVLCVAGVVVGRLNRNHILALFRERWQVIVAAEVVFLVALVFFLLIRAGNPDLWRPWQGGEASMDFAYLNSVLKATWFPPQDPWFAGGAINYYYFGFVLIGAPVKALGIDPSVAYTIVLPTLFALVASGAFGLGASFYANVRRITTEGTKMGEIATTRIRNAIVAGAITAIIVVFIANGNLPTHMIAIPLASLALAFALAFTGGARRWPAILLGSIATGMLWPTNPSDYLPYALLSVSGLALGALAQRGAEPLTSGRRISRLAHSLPTIVVFAVLTRAVMAPYLASYGSDGLVYRSDALNQGPCGGADKASPLVHDYEAIKWMQDHVQGSPTIIEDGVAAGNSYCWSARFAINTGLPTVVGWQFQQQQQRAAIGMQIITDRVNDVQSFYSTRSVDYARAILLRYGVKYVVVGEIEKLYNDPAGLAKFNAMLQTGDLRIAYQNEGTTIYEMLQTIE